MSAASTIRTRQWWGPPLPKCHKRTHSEGLARRAEGAKVREGVRGTVSTLVILVATLCMPKRGAVREENSGQWKQKTRTSIMQEEGSDRTTRPHCGVKGRGGGNTAAQRPHTHKKMHATLTSVHTALTKH